MGVLSQGALSATLGIQSPIACQTPMWFYRIVPQSQTYRSSISKPFFLESNGSLGRIAA